MATRNRTVLGAARLELGGSLALGKLGLSQQEAQSPACPYANHHGPYLVHGCQPRRRLLPAAVCILPCSQLQLGHALRPWG